MEFAGIGGFIGGPLRTYPAGMLMRLAFSVAINMDPEISLIDEVPALGDQAFRAKCFERVHWFRHAPLPPRTKYPSSLPQSRLDSSSMRSSG